jgi:hypothetical protein
MSRPKFHDSIACQNCATLCATLDDVEAERDALLAALKEALPLVESVYLDEYDKDRKSEFTQAYFEQLERHKAAIAAAEGKETP